MNSYSKKGSKYSQNLVASFLDSIPKIIGMPKMEFCRLMGEVLAKSPQTIHDYMQRKYIPKEYTSKDLIVAIDSAISIYVPHSGKKSAEKESTGKKLTEEQSAEKESIKKRWENFKEYFSFVGLFLDLSNAVDFINKLDLEENLPRVFITQFLNADLSNIRFENNEEIRKFLVYLQSCIKKVPRIENFLYSEEDAEAYARIAREMKNIPKLKPIHIQIKENS